MRSIKGLYSPIKKENMVIGKYYGISLRDDIYESSDSCEWMFRFVGFNANGGSIMSDITYYRDIFGWEYSGDYISILCHDNEIVDGSIRKYSEKKFKEKLGLR
jgi:hypothetical protein